MKCLECRYLFSGFDHAQEAGDREIEQGIIMFCIAAISQKTAKEAKSSEIPNLASHRGGPWPAQPAREAAFSSGSGQCFPVV